MTCVLVLMVGIVSLVSYSVPVSAESTCGDAKTFFDWGCTNTSDTSQEQIKPVLITILNWLAMGVSIAVVGGIIYGGIMYTSSGGDTAKSKKAMEIIRNAVIALLMFFAMWALINWLVPGGLFSA